MDYVEMIKLTFYDKIRYLNLTLSCAQKTVKWNVKAYRMSQTQ